MRLVFSRSFHKPRHGKFKLSGKRPKCAAAPQMPAARPPLLTVGCAASFFALLAVLLLLRGFLLATAAPDYAPAVERARPLLPPSGVAAGGDGAAPLLAAATASASPPPLSASGSPSPLLPPLPPSSFSPPPAARPGEAVRWAVVVQGPIYPQGKGSWGNAQLDVVWPGARDALLRVLSTWDTAPSQLVAEYAADGFVPVLSVWDDFFRARTGGGAGNVNLQMHTTYNGLLRARELGATHAIKARADVRVTNARVFLEQVLGTPHTLSFLTKWVGAPRYAVEHLVAGPIEDMLAYFGPPYKNETVDGRFPELFLMESFSEKRGWAAEDGATHIKFCREVDWFYPRLPKGLYFFDHKGLNAESDMSGPYTPYDVTQGDLCALGRARARARMLRGGVGGPK